MMRMTSNAQLPRAPRPPAAPSPTPPPPPHPLEGITDYTELFMPISTYQLSGGTLWLDTSWTDLTWTRGRKTLYKKTKHTRQTETKKKTNNWHTTEVQERRQHRLERQNTKPTRIYEEKPRLWQDKHRQDLMTCRLIVGRQDRHRTKESCRVVAHRRHVFPDIWWRKCTDLRH